ncbi:MAG: DUF4239 domain-containing protein, partial [Candidatus Margulisbacteria bacterium]|nr:DUF4239 domain-containing protein [Candidatus Margulisiibacteriota bacterium]
MSTPVLGLVIVAAYVGFSVLGLFIIRAFFPPHKFKLHNDVAGSIFATLGVIYAVLLAFMVIVTWQNYDEANKNAAREANYLADLYRDSTPLPAAFRSELKTDLKNYVDSIINDEWPIMARGERSAKVQAAQGKLWSLYGGFLPKNETAKVFFAESVKKLNEACETRRQRLLDATSGIHPILYFVLIFGGLLTVAYMLLFGSENFGPQLIMTSMLAALIALTLFTIVALDYPFTGDISIKPDVF